VNYKEGIHFGLVKKLLKVVENIENVSCLNMKKSQIKCQLRCCYFYLYVFISKELPAKEGFSAAIQGCVRPGKDTERVRGT